MIYAAAKPIQEYDVYLGGQAYGLYSEHGHFPERLALILLITPFGYDYELGDTPPEKARVNMKSLETVEKTLLSEIEGVTVKEYLQALNPIEFYNLISSTDVTHLPIVEKDFKGNPQVLEFIVGARAATWAEHYKGETAREGNIIKVNFGGAETTLEVPEIIKEYKQTIERGRKDDKK